MHPAATPDRPLPPAHCRPVRGAVALVAACLLLTSCSGAEEARERQDDPGLAPEPIKRVDKDKAAVEDTLTAYNRLVRASLQRGRGRVSSERLRRVVAEPYATRLGRRLGAERRAGLVMRGADSYRTLRVQVSGRRAILVTCFDSSGADVVNVSTTPPRAVAPAAPNRTTFRLVRAASPTGWLISRRTAGAGC